MAAALDGCVEVCVISFLDLYRKVQRNFPEARAVPAAARIRLGRAMARIAKSHHMRLKACAEGDELAPYGVDCSGCMTMEVYEHALHARLSPPSGAVHPGRKECACYLGGDIGAYDSCGHLCRYCYANASPEAVRRNRRLHDPASPFLIGGLLPGDEVRDARQEKLAGRAASFLRDRGKGGGPCPTKRTRRSRSWRLTAPCTPPCRRSTTARRRRWRR